MPQVLIVADDLTGAADTGAVFAQAGLSTSVLLRLEPSVAALAQRPDVLVVSTESRALEEAVAVARVRAAASLATHAAIVYKKIDSTLRGHPAAELAALAEELGCDSVLIAPAFPAQGRTTVGGIQRLHGQPIENTIFGSEVPCADLARLFSTRARPAYPIPLPLVRSGPTAVARALADQRPAVFIADAETDEDLATLGTAARLAGLRLLCGSAGLARLLPVTLHLQPARERPAWERRQGGPVLIIAGSRNPRTLRQVEAAQAAGATVVAVPQAYLHGEGAADEVARTLLVQLSKSRCLILTTAGATPSPLGPEAVAARLAAVAAKLAQSIMLGGVIMTGGDVAAATCGALGASTICLTGEVEPGIAAGVLGDGPYSGLSIVTKAGGFGRDNALVTAVRYLGGTLSP